MSQLLTILYFLIGGDQFTGRVACGLELGTTNFSTLPPHFDSTSTNYALIDWQSFVPGWDNYCFEFRSVLKLVTASLVYHSESLHDWLPERHPIFVSRFWLDNWNGRLRSLVLVGNTNCDQTGMVATGIPPSVHIMRSIEDMHKKSESSFERTQNMLQDFLKVDLPNRLQELSSRNGLLRNSSSSFQINDEFRNLFEEFNSSINEIKAELSIHRKAITTPITGQNG